MQVTDAFLEEQNMIYLESQMRQACRNAEEARARQERERELEAERERQRQRQEEAMAQPPSISLPQVCRRHNLRQGCTDSNCRRLHICRLFLADICKYGATCRYNHSLTTVHNQASEMTSSFMMFV